MRPRVPFKLESIAFRCYALSGKEIREKSQLIRSICLLQVHLNSCRPLTRRYFRLKRQVYLLLAALYKYMFYSPTVKASWRSFHERVRIERWSDEELWNLNRIRRHDFHKLLVILHLDAERLVVDDHGSAFSGEELLILARYKFITGLKFTHMCSLFKRDSSQLSRAFNFFIRHMVDNFLHLLSDGNLEYWLKYFPTFSESIRKKFADVTGIHYPPNHYRVCCYIDDTVIRICRPGAGPNPDGTRKNNDIQRAFYNGWKKQHGIKYQSLEAPNGMCMHLFGPLSCRRSDLELLSLSNINETMRNLQEGEAAQYAGYGDGIFPILSHIISKHDGENLSELLMDENNGMHSIRVSNEWSYGHTGNLFPFVKDHRNFKILQNKQCGSYYYVATLLKNAQICLYGSNSSIYFNCPIPSLEEYFQYE